MKITALFLFLASGLAYGQAPQVGAQASKQDPAKQQAPSKQELKYQEDSAAKVKLISDAEKNGVDVRIKGIAHFRGIRGNQLMGMGLIVGLAGSGDTKKSAISQQIIANLFKEIGVGIKPADLDLKNVAAVMVTAELPPFATNGQLVDVQVQSIGDAKSLVGGTLIQSALYAAGDQSTVYVSAQGSVDVGGYDVSQGGSSSKKGFVTAGRVPEGGIVERGAPTKFVIEGKVYLDLNQPALTTAMRVASKITETFPNLNAVAINGGSIELTIPDGLSAMEAMSRIEELHVFADTQETIVINEKTGTIVIGGNVRLGPAAVVHGNLSVKIDQEIRVSQPDAFSLGTTQLTQKTTIDVKEPKADVTSFAPNTTVSDLARVFHALQLKASDVISILQALRAQGALKARIISQ
jgi:flagellar P-ring protein precursor FlgI